MELHTIIPHPVGPVDPNLAGVNRSRNLHPCAVIIVIVTPRPVRLATQGLGRMITIGCESDVSTCLLHALSVARRMWSAHRVSLVSLACNARLCGSALSAVPVRRRGRTVRCGSAAGADGAGATRRMTRREPVRALPLSCHRSSHTADLSLRRSTVASSSQTSPPRVTLLCRVVCFTPTVSSLGKARFITRCPWRVGRRRCRRSRRRRARAWKRAPVPARARHG